MQVFTSKSRTACLTLSTPTPNSNVNNRLDAVLVKIREERQLILKIMGRQILILINRQQPWQDSSSLLKAKKRNLSRCYCRNHRTVTGSSSISWSNWTKRRLTWLWSGKPAQLSKLIRVIILGSCQRFRMQSRTRTTVCSQGPFCRLLLRSVARSASIFSPRFVTASCLPSNSSSRIGP